MGQAILIVSGIEQALADPAKVAAMAAGMGFDLSKLPPGVDIYTVLGQLPPAQLAKLMSPYTSKFATLSDSMIVQASARPLLAEYTALGMDTMKLSTSYIIQIGLVMLLITLISGICMILVGYLSARTAAGLARDLRRYVFHRLADYPIYERYHPDPDGRHHDNAYGFLCTHHCDRWHHPSHRNKRQHVVDYCTGGRCDSRLDPDSIHNCPTKI
jgi:ATP-binding cassette subfamily B protein